MNESRKPAQPGCQIGRTGDADALKDLHLSIYIESKKCNSSTRRSFPKSFIENQANTLKKGIVH